MELPSNRNYRGGRSAGRKLTKPEQTEVGRKLRVAAMDGDVNAMLALSNFALAEALTKEHKQLVEKLATAA